MAEEKPQFVADDYGRYVAGDGVAQFAEPSEFDLRDVLQAAQRYNPENDVRDMRRLGKKQELKVRMKVRRLPHRAEADVLSDDFDSSPLEATSCCSA